MLQVCDGLGHFQPSCSRKRKLRDALWGSVHYTGSAADELTASNHRTRLPVNHISLRINAMSEKPTNGSMEALERGKMNEKRHEDGYLVCVPATLPPKYADDVLASCICCATPLRRRPTSTASAQSICLSCYNTAKETSDPSETAYKALRDLRTYFGTSADGPNSSNRRI